MKTIHGEMYISDCAFSNRRGFLKGKTPERPFCMIESVRTRRDRHDKDSILQNDNARLHSSRQTQDTFRQLELTTLPHPAYIPDLVPSDYYLFPQLKKYLKGHRYDNDEEVIADVHRLCHGHSSEFFAFGLRNLVKRWRLCVDRDGEYVEK
ncbi:histone-lysine N-methyltransferase SETMAR [Plakobranchus ocellatus]|uniref:Histone-lysine N-methyltransferase SETMAR n=1 Tax=Plakobranchus ocellatus TaxID=259542 RepID=A0AAV3XZ11_9GAST|nr:histone-lysine N-methyltransferase SETMAR [Plakobranchus ocellatus]